MHDDCEATRSSFFRLVPWAGGLPDVGAIRAMRKQAANNMDVAASLHPISRNRLTESGHAKARLRVVFDHSHQRADASLPPCCGRDKSGHAAAAPPSSVMKSRRFTPKQIYPWFAPRGTRHARRREQKPVPERKIPGGGKLAAVAAGAGPCGCPSTLRRQTSMN